MENKTGPDNTGNTVEDVWEAVDQNDANNWSKACKDDKEMV